MKLRHLLLAAALAVTAVKMGVRDGLTESNPGGSNGDGKGARDVNKVIVNVGTFNVWDYGSNFLSLDILLSNPNEVALNSSVGSTELYGVYRGQLSPDKIFGLNTKFGPITAINFEAGGDLETENTAFAPDKKLLVVGPNVHFDLGSGFLNVGIHFSKEWNNNGIAGTAVSFSPAAEFEFVWLYSLKKLTGLPLDFKGFVNVVTPKGINGFGGQTYTEVLARPTLSLDVGSMVFHKPHVPDVFLALELWEHKFGNSDSLPGAEEVAPEIGFEVHF
jgi:nucleoside-specific outer membrane channel protein Tsx